MNRIAAWLMTLTVMLMPLLIVLANIYFFTTSAFIQFEYSRPDFPPSQRFTPEERYYYATETVRYVRTETSLTDLQALGVYNDREIKHLVDARNVLQAVLVVHAVAAVLAVLALLVLARSAVTRLWGARALFYGGIFTLVLIGAIGLYSLVAFDQFFVQFHHLFFEGTTWLFEYTDSLIQFYPEPFWEAAAYGIALFAIVEAGLVTLAGWLWERRLTRRPAAVPQPAS